MLLIVNPAAASGATLRNLEIARQGLIRLGLDFSERITNGPGDAARLTRAAIAAGETRIIAVGGDGTLNEVVSGYFDFSGSAINPSAINPAAAIGLLPSGTGSDFCRSLSIVTTMDAVAAIARDRVRLIDIASVVLRDLDGAEQQRFLVNAGSFGFGGATAARVNSWRNILPQWVGGQPRFVFAALGALRNYRNRPVRLLLDKSRELEVSSDLIVVANGRYAGSGMKLAPLAEFDDGLLDVLIADNVSRAGIVRELTRVWDGSHLLNSQVQMLRARSVEISGSPELAMDLDGESAGSTPAAITVMPSSLRFII